MVVSDFHIPGMAITPTETNAPLSVDADTPLASPVAPQGFQTVSRRYFQVFRASCGIQKPEFVESPGLDFRR